MWCSKSVAGVAALIGAIAIAGNAQAQGTGIAMRPGVTVTFSIYGGHSSSGEFLGDYDFVNKLTEVSQGGYRYDYFFTGPAIHTGSQSVSPDDNKTGTMLREYWGGGDQSAKGYISYLRVSDATFADLKAGKETRFEMDDAENPRSLKPVGYEDLATLVNEKEVKLHTIKAQGAAGGTFWILDDPGFPMIVKGETKWNWMATSIGDTAATDKQIVADLKATGIATTHAILFAFNSAEIEPQSKPVIAAVAQYLKASPAVRLEIQGHTDGIGGPAANQALSEKRAGAVKAALVGAGIAAGRLAAKGYGPSVPVADNAAPEGRAQNRRVVFRQF